MAILAGNLEVHLSGGAGNTDPDASLGGVISPTEIVDATPHNLFGEIDGDMAAAGGTTYRCIYAKNAHGSLTWKAVKTWISSQTPSASTSIEIGIGTSAAGGTEQTIANETTSPVGVSFASPSAKAQGLALGDIPAGSHKAIWVKRVVTAGASAYTNDGSVIRIEGDTAP